MRGNSTVLTSKILCPLSTVYRPIRMSWRRIASALFPSAVILLYHRVCRLECDPQLLAVTPEHFGEHLEVLRKKFCLASLEALLCRVSDSKIQRRMVIITFDDGYADNLLEAKPLLERFEVSATVFIAAHFVDRKQEFFWDELERILLSPGRLPPRIRIVVASGTFELDLQEIADYPETEQRRYRHWSVLEQKAPTPRQSLYRNFCCFVRDLTPCEREDALSQLRAWASTPADARDSHRTLTSPEVRQLQDGGLIEIGAHTLTHPVLSRLRADEQRLEIAGSREKLEAIVSRPVHSFSYPFGSPDDYTEDTARIVREAGFECACSNFCRRVSSKTHRFHLPRMLVRDWNGREFEERLTACFRA